MNSEKDIFEEELKELDSAINIEYNTFKFKVFSLEASSGKTRQTIASAIKSKREILIVTKFKVEVDMIVKEINKGAGFAKAAGVVSDIELIKNNSNLYLSARNIEFNKYKVIVITHSQYSKMCTGENVNLIKLVERFTTLIIDEELNPIKNNLYTFTLKKNEEIKVLFTSFGMGEEFKELTNILELQFSKKEYKPINQLHWIDLNEDITYIKGKCEEIRRLIKNEEENITIKLIDVKLATGYNYCLSELIDYIDLIEKIIINSIEGYSLIDVNEKVISTYDYNFSYFKLTNNIMLDASASFSTLYNSDKFEVVKTKRKIDHSKCKITVINLKTTTSSKSKINHLFRDKLKNYVTKVLGDTDKGLIVTKKDEAKYLEDFSFVDFDKEVKDEIEMINSDLFKNIEYEERISFCNYENQRGRNDYAEYKHCFLAHTYRQPRFYYVFLYRYFFGVKTTSKEMETVHKKDESGLKYWGFHSCNELQQLMLTDMISCQYQSLKRVERNRNPKGHYHIISNDSIVINSIIEQLKGFNMKNYEVIQEEEFLGERVSKRSKKDILKEYIEERLAQGKWEKVKSSDLKKRLNISDKTWREIWKDEDLLSFCKEKRIKEGKPRAEKVNHVFKY